MELVSGDTAPLDAPVRCILETRARCVLHIESTVSAPATSHFALHTGHIHGNEDTSPAVIIVHCRCSFPEDPPRCDTLLGNERVVTRYGDVTRPCHTFFPVNERFGGERAGREGPIFSGTKGCLPRARRKNFSLVSMTAALFALGIYDRTHVPFAFDADRILLIGTESLIKFDLGISCVLCDVVCTRVRASGRAVEMRLSV